MSNPYIEKSASLYDFWNDLKGHDHNDLKARKHHLERAIAHKDTVESLSHKIQETGRRTYSARSKVAIGAAGLSALGVYGVKKYSDIQSAKANKNLTELYNLHKRASVVKATAKLAGKAVKKTLVGVGYAAGKVGGVLDTAHGGKVEKFALDRVGNKHSPNFKKFMNSSKAERNTFVSGPDLDKLKKLHTQQRIAQVGAYGSAAGITLAYSKGKKKSQEQSYPTYYY